MRHCEIVKHFHVCEVLVEFVMMKRKHGEYKPNPSFTKDSHGDKSQYFNDPRLASRVKQYLKSHKHKSVISVIAMAQYLQATYSEYERKKQVPFQKAVEKAYHYVERLETKNNEPPQQDETSKLEDKHRLKRMKEKVIDISSSSSDSFSEDNAEYTEYKDKNTLNSFMANMYRNSPHRSVSQPCSRNPSAPSSPMRIDHVASDTDVAFMIDRSGSRGTRPQDEKVLKGQIGPQNSTTVASFLEDQNRKPGERLSEGASTIKKDSLGVTTPIVKIEPKDKITSEQSKTVRDKRTDRKKKNPAQDGKDFRKKLGLTGDEDKKKGAEVTKSAVKFADVGGNDKTLKEICKLLVHMKHPEIYEQLGVTPPRGFLLHGPPGCGKTLLAQAIAGELDLPMIKLASTEIVSGVSGESEEKIRDVFDKALTNAPCVLFLDEIDSITPKRETASKDMERRIVSQLLTCLDDLNTRTTAHVLVIGATNRPDSIDPGLRRAGRFDREISLGIPDESSRKSILEVLCRGLKLLAGFDFASLAKSTPGFVGADLMALAREAAMVAVNRVFQNLENKEIKKSTNTNKLIGSPDITLPRSEISDITHDLSDDVPSEKNEVIYLEQVKEKPDNATNGPDTSVPMEIIEEDKLTDGSVAKPIEVQSSSDNQETQKKCTNETFHLQQTVVQEKNEGQMIKSEKVSNKSTSDGDLKSVLSWLHDQPPLSEDELKTLFITMEDFQGALKVVQPSAKREGFATIPDVTWDDIGALHDVREELQMCILGPVRYPDQFKAMGLTNPPGILLAGPPGCGKTLLAKAVANESGINFISVKGPELLNMYVGESERAVRQVFQRARNSSPCVIFFDELDALCPRRSHSGEGGSSVRVVNQLLTEMDGLEERKQVFIMGATNRPDIIDPAILRPGRLDKTLYVGLPSPQDRLDILNTVTKNGTKPNLSSDVDLHQVANSDKCEGFTGADLAALVREAAVSALREFMTVAPSGGQVLVCSKHFDTAFMKVKPSVSAKDQLLYKDMRMRVQT